MWEAAFVTTVAGLTFYSLTCCGINNSVNVQPSERQKIYLPSCLLSYVGGPKCSRNSGVFFSNRMRMETKSPVCMNKLASAFLSLLEASLEEEHLPSDMALSSAVA
jgi:hypothetical protein